ncbi:MAG: hypothetical protein ACJ74O_01210 [Frankiaceae bacterium]
MCRHWLGKVAAGTAVVLSSLSVVTLSGQSAFAAVPPNDVLAGATTVTTLPFSDTVDVTQATTDAQDAQVNASCGAPATEHSVWYSYSPSSDGAILVDVSQSDFSAGVIIATGTPGALDTWACGPGEVAAPTFAGETYYVMAFADTPGDPGGTLRLTVDVAPPPPTVEVTVAPKGTVSKGVATLHGTYVCTGDAEFVDIFGELRQPVGRLAVIGEFETFVAPPACDGAAHPWSADVFGENGKFAGGKSASVTIALACNVFQCSEWDTQQAVHLSGATKK